MLLFQILLVFRTYCEVLSDYWLTRSKKGPHEAFLGACAVLCVMVRVQFETAQRGLLYEDFLSAYDVDACGESADGAGCLHVLAEECAVEAVNVHDGGKYHYVLADAGDVAAFGDVYGGCCAFSAHTGGVLSVVVAAVGTDGHLAALGEAE